MAAIGASLLLMLLASAGAAGAGGCREITFEAERFTACEAEAGEDLRLFLDDADGTPLGTFERLGGRLAAEGRGIVFAMNAGMYHADRRPVGLYIEEGREVSALVTAAGPGNFGLVPNGVFCIRQTGFAVIETRTYAAGPQDCRFATQSGPMLVIGGALHPRFLPGSVSRHVRNGVGVTADGRRAVFVVSSGPVNFDLFARVFRDGLGLPDALYLDGSISRLYVPALGRDDLGFPMGPIVALVAPAAGSK